MQAIFRQEIYNSISGNELKNVSFARGKKQKRSGTVVYTKFLTGSGAV
jgi:hypothetical protein